MEKSCREGLVLDLKKKIRNLERATVSDAERGVYSTGLKELDRLLPEGGIGFGSLIEWLEASEGGGTAMLALLLAARVQKRHGGTLVVLDGQREFYPPAAAAFGIPLAKTMVICAGQAKEHL